MVLIKYWALFLWKTKEKKFQMKSAAVLISALRVKCFSAVEECFLFSFKHTGPSCSKLNEVVSYHDMKIFVSKYGKYIDIFCWKNVSSKIHSHICSKISMYLKLEQVDGEPSHIPVPAPSHISVHIKIPNAFLQSSSIGLSPVKVFRF